MRKRLRSVGAITLAITLAVTMLPDVAPKASAAGGTYSFYDDYSIGWRNGVVAYQDGKSTSLDAAGVKIYSQEGDNPFEAQVEQAWDEPNLVLSMPVKYTTEDGVAHPVESMLTNFNFIADPTAIDNEEVDGKLYVYGTTEAFSYTNGTMVDNKYANHSLTILSTTDMVNWTDEGFMDSRNLTNEPSTSANQVQGKFTNGNSWAPSGLKIDQDGDGKFKYYLFYTNGGATGYVMSDSPTGPWEEPEGGALLHSGTPNCSDCSTCFDPAVLVDDKGDAYVYFGGLSRTSGRAVQVQFNPLTDRVERVGDPVKLPTYAMFEDNEINQFNGLYYYSYCTDYNSQSLTDGMSIAVYVSSDPLDICFEPSNNKAEAYEPFTDPNTGVYHHFLGTILKNPSVIYGQTYNNHHHMQSFKGHDYIFYHSTVLNNSLHRYSRQYRNLHVDEIDINAETDDITIEPSYEGAEQIESFNPYKNYDGSDKVINATTTSYSAGVKSAQSDVLLMDQDVMESNYLSPMVLDEIHTGDWTKLQGVDFGEKVDSVEASFTSATSDGAIEVFIDDPTNPDNMVASMPVSVTAEDEFTTVKADITGDVNGVHDVYFVFRGSDYQVATWKFNASEAVVAPTSAPATQTPQVTPVPQTTPEAAVDVNKTYTVKGIDYKVDTEGSAAVTSVSKKAAKVTVPATVAIEGKEYKVTEIAAGAYKNAKKLKSVVIGKNVKKIAPKAFMGCKSLKKITIKSTVLKKVGKNAFKGINAKAVIKVPAKKKAAYTKLLKGKGQKKSVKIK